MWLAIDEKELVVELQLGLHNFSRSIQYKVLSVALVIVLE